MLISGKIRNAQLTLAFMLSLLMLLFCGYASAAVYWGNRSSIGRANSNFGLANLYFVGAVNSIDFGWACGVAVNDTHIFWADKNYDTIGRANLDGSNPIYSFISGADNPCGIALDETYIYWANRGGNAIGRARLDGSEHNPMFVGVVTDPCGVAVDDRFIYWASAGGQYVGRALVQSGIRGPNLYEGSKDYDLCGVAVNQEHIFWGSYGRVIGRANLDGSEPDNAFIDGLASPCSIAVDKGHIYWTEEGFDGDGRISRANLDGTMMNRYDVEGLMFPCGIATDSVVVSPPALPVLLPEKSSCTVMKVLRNKGDATAVIVVKADPLGEVRVKTRGLRWRVLPGKPAPGRGRRHLWRLKVWPGTKGRIAMQIRRQLVRRGQARIKLRIWCLGEEERDVPTIKTRSLTLHRRRSAPVEKPSHLRSGRQPAGIRAG